MAKIVSSIALFLLSRDSHTSPPFADDYRSHTTCITEVERYEKRDPVKKKSGKIPPQELWMDLVASSVATAPGRLRNHLQVIATLSNVPRKEKQFRNFAANSLNLRGKKNGETIVAEIWKYLQSRREEQQQHNKAQSKAADESKDTQTDSKEQVTTEEATSMKPSDRKLGEAAKISNENGYSQADPKSVKKAMKKVLKKASNHSMSIKRLRKAVQAHLGLPKSSKKSLKGLLRQNLQEAKKQTFVLDGKTVTLQTD